jgi:amino acid transporter
LGSLTITAMAFGHGDAGDAFSRALRRSPAALGAVLLLAIGAVLLALPFAVLMVVASAGGKAAGAMIGLLLGLVFIIAWVRLMLMTSVAAAEAGGSFAILKRSWNLTRGHTLRLFGFVLVVVIVFLVVMLAVSAIFGSVIILAAGQPQDGNLSSVLIALVGGITNAALGLFLTAMIARIYVQLAEDPISGS